MRGRVGGPLAWIRTGRRGAVEGKGGAVPVESPNVAEFSIGAKTSA